MVEFIKRIFAVILSFLQMLVLNVSYGEYVEPEKPEKEEVQLVNDISGDTSLDESIKFASAIASKADGYYTDAERSAYAMENANAVLTHTLGKVNSATLADTDGKVYIADSFDSFYEQDGLRSYFSTSKDKGRVNTIRLGEYYFECHVRDYGAAENFFKVDKAYHVYGDRLYAQYSLMASEATTDLEAFGSEIRIDANTVKAVEVKDANGVHSELINIDYASVEYAAFDIDGVGVVGFIVPNDGSTKETVVEQFGDTYYVRQYANYTAGTGINKFDETGGYSLNNVTFGFRIYTDATHSFDGVAKKNYEEKNPLTVTVDAANSNAAYLGYDALTGAYTLRMDGTDFNTAYANPQLQYRAPITVTGDSNDRELYIRSKGNNGCLEAGAILDDTNTLVPINVQVCKNFQGDGGEPFYSVKDYQYGDSYFPVSVKANEEISFTLLNLYQNWGHNPLKQLSSIEFHVSYYHLSTGTTESNCIAPYFVGNKDGWLLPDFRTRSGKMWAEQPQFNSVGVLNFMTYNKKAFGIIPTETVMSEYTGCKIDSTGLLYSDITSDYVSDCGSYTYSLRHVEFPQVDENRTYYTLDVQFNREITFSNFKRDFDLFYFDGRFVDYNKFGYLDESNTAANADAKVIKDTYYNLGSNCPYWGFYDVTDGTADQLANHFGCNFAMVIKDSSIVVGGEKQDIAFAARINAGEERTSGSLTLNAEEITFMPGDSIKIDMILLPWGVGNEEHDNNVRYVREDSALKPIKVEAFTGEVVEDAFIPTIRAESGKADFVLSGGRNNIAVKIMGFTDLQSPKVYVVNGDIKELVNPATELGYDGYYVQYEEDGTYTFTYLYGPGSPDDSIRICVEQ